MLFQVYGDNAIYQWIGWILVFCCLIGANELARRTKTGLRVKMCVWLGVSRGLDLAFLNAD